ncbi:PEPxxWA-CTERM sorting domain-containing protein [Sphingomonas sp. dw_22]|uniref:PEPxxWA-CTERM sorting domain-containing protein n=1 Tax=Sphingomonas sp. dw_22 TaxID=2721175 RepID=UPI002116913B|nr:PEPxxWA-CTERM sorting domain-containing protein [Sphingomonas sp. dw_22]
MRKFIVAALLASSTLVAAPAQAQITYYTNYAAFLGALGGTAVIEDFEDTTLVPGLAYASSAGNISGGLFNDQLIPSSQTTTFVFGGAVNAFGGFFDLSPGGPGLGIQLTNAPGSTLALEVPNTYSGQFWGFISNNSFQALLLTAGTQGGVAETYTLNNLTFGTGTPGVPEPAAWGMMIGGFGLAGMALRRRHIRTTVSYA